MPVWVASRVATKWSRLHDNPHAEERGGHNRPGRVLLDGQADHTVQTEGRPVVCPDTRAHQVAHPFARECFARTQQSSVCHVAETFIGQFATWYWNQRTGWRHCCLAWKVCCLAWKVCFFLFYMYYHPMLSQVFIIAIFKKFGCTVLTCKILSILIQNLRMILSSFTSDNAITFFTNDRIQTDSNIYQLLGMFYGLLHGIFEWIATFYLLIKST